MRWKLHPHRQAEEVTDKRLFVGGAKAHYVAACVGDELLHAQDGRAHHVENIYTV